jgi:hypothetical protein
MRSFLIRYVSFHAIDRTCSLLRPRSELQSCAAPLKGRTKLLLGPSIKKPRQCLTVAHHPAPVLNLA